jgi:hypothetical protein
MPPIAARTNAFTRLGLGVRQCRIDDDGEPVGLAAIVGEFQHRQIVGRHAPVLKIDRGQIGKSGDGVDLAGRQHRLAHRGADAALSDVLDLDVVLLGHRRPQPDRQIAFGNAQGLALDIRQCLNAAALAGDDGVGRFVEQHEDRLDPGAALLVLVAKAHQAR